jgi:hypothetical protein
LGFGCRYKTQVVDYQAEKKDAECFLLLSSSLNTRFISFIIYENSGNKEILIIIEKKRMLFTFSGHVSELIKII